METWTKFLLNEIIVTGDELYLKSAQQGDRCLIEVPPEQVYTSFFLGNKKITLFVSEDSKVIEKLTAASANFAKGIILSSVEGFLRDNPGIFSMTNKHVALWMYDKAYYLFDPAEYDQYGNLWGGIPGSGLALLARFKKLQDLIDFLYQSYYNSKAVSSQFQLIACGISRIVTVNVAPPDSFEAIKPKEEEMILVPEETLPPPPRDYKFEALKQYVEEDKAPVEPRAIRVHEISPFVTESLSMEKRPSWLRNGSINKQDFCRYPMPIPTFLKSETTKLTYYTELVPLQISILRGSTCQTDPKFSKYGGRQSMGNAISALVMLRMCKSKFWVPSTVDTMLQYGDILYRDAMLTIPRTQSLCLSNFAKRMEYRGRYFNAEIEEYAVVGQLQSQDYEILDLERALEDFLTDNDCCVILGPQIMAVWIEDDFYCLFDPNERDQYGKCNLKGDDPKGVACVLRSKNLKDLVDIYIHNTDKSKRNDGFYISKVKINDYNDVPNDWHNFKGVGTAKWILRGSFDQGNFKFSPESRNTQGTANALIALAMQKLIGFEEWTGPIIDEVLTVGDEFYKNSVEYLQTKELFKQPMLMLSELNRRHTLRDKKVDFELDECVVNGLVYADGSNDLPNLEKGLSSYFRVYDSGVLTIRTISLALWKYKEAYFYLDPYTRDHEGLATGYGTSCVIRSTNLEDFAKFIEYNLEPGSEDVYNISYVKVALNDIGVDDTVVPPLNKYTKLSESSAILRSWISENADKYETRKGKQTVPMCLVSVSFNKLKPAKDWTKNDLGAILDKGDALYVQTMEKVQYNVEQKEIVGEDPAGGGDGIPEESDEKFLEEDAKFEITSNNVNKEFDIGPNKFTMTFADVAEGNIKKELKSSLRNFFEDDNRTALLEINCYSVAVWRDQNIYFLFDPKPRDKTGRTIGREDWESEKEEIEDQVIEEKENEQENEEDVEDNEEDIEGNEVLEGAENETVDEDDVEETTTEDVMPEEEVLPKQPPKLKKSPSFWLEQEKMGRACTLWFAKLEEFVNHIYENIPTNDRADKNFQLKSIEVANTVQLKIRHNAEHEVEGVYSGDFYDFKEIEYGRWILRGTIDLSHELFPEANRGRQTLTASIMALAIAHIYEMTCFVSSTPDTILTYGDKLYTYMKKLKKKQLLDQDRSKLTEDEVDWLLKHEDFNITNVPTKICVSKFMVHLEVEPAVVNGDVKAQTFEEVYDVKRGLENFFRDSKYGVVSSKGLNVAVWRGEYVYYMFDGLKRGPNGIQSSMGTACITRYLSLTNLADVFVQNLPRCGNNQFFIHRVTLGRDLCPRGGEPGKTIPMPKLPTRKLIGPGKSITRGNISQEDPRFGKGPNEMSAPIAITALAMSMIHKADTWSRAIIDEIVILGAELYEDSVTQQGYNFNPWEGALDVYKVKKQFKIGVVKISCETREASQKGILDTKNPAIKNLRQGIESFFEENTHGILITENLTLAIWEGKNDSDLPLIYVFEPNPRSPTGMPVFNGTACLLVFANAKIASDHIIGCILDPDNRRGEYTIVPVEIVIGSWKSIRKSATKSNANVLPRCSKLVASEQKRMLRRLADEERKRKEAKRLHMIGRNGYHLTKGGEAILRGYLSQNHEKYAEESRDNQDIPNCVVSVVMHCMVPVDEWTCKYIDLILDIGDQLYVDSYIAYGPKDKKLGMENILRKFYMGELEVHVTIYKPIVTEIMTTDKLLMILEGYFQQEPWCILNYKDLWVSMFYKSGYYYLFDPHQRNVEGNVLSKNDDRGTAVVVRFDNVSTMIPKLINNLKSNNENIDNFSLWSISVETR